MKIFTIKKVLSSLFILYTLIGFFLIPYLITSKLPPIVSEAIQAHFSVEKTSFNPFIFELTLSGVALNDPEEQDFAAIKKIKLNLDPFALILGKVQINELLLTKPDINVVQHASGQFNFDWLLNLPSASDQELPEPEPSSDDGLASLPHIVVKRAVIHKGELSYHDLTRATPFHLNIGPIGFQILDLDTRNIHSESDTVRLHLALYDGGFLDIQSEFTSLEPLALQGSIHFEAGKLYTPWQFLQDNLNLEIADGKMQMHFDYSVDTADLNATKLENIHVALEQLRVKPKAEHDDLLRIGALTLNGGVIEPLRQNIALENISLNDATIHIAREKNGSINWIRHLASDDKAQSQPAEDESGSNTAPWKLTLNDFMINRAKIILDDHSIRNPTSILLDQIDVHAAQISSEPESTLNYNASLRINKKGVLQTSGALQHSPLQNHSSIKLSDLDLSDFNAYLEASTYLGIDRGDLSFESTLTYDATQPSPDIQVEGNLSVRDFVLQDMHDNSLLAGWDEVRINPFKFDGTANDLMIEEVMLHSLYVNAIVDANQSFNFSQLLKENNESVQAAADDHNQSDTKPFNVRIIKFNIIDSNANFADFSLPLKFQTFIHDVNGQVYGVSTQAGQTSYISINGQVDKYGSAKIGGSLNSADPKSYTDIGLTFRNLDLQSVTPYSGKFIGRKIDTGKLFLTLDYDLNNAQMQGENSIIIKKLTLGEAVESNDSMSLPLDLAIALLEDSEGVIDIDMPVEGDVDNPDFKWGATAWGAFGSLITKAVTAPFSFLGSLLGFDAEQLEYIEFESGKSVILPSEREKLDTLGKALKKRPKLALSVTGTYALNADTYSLKRAKLLALIMKRTKADKSNHDQAMSIEILEQLHLEYFPEHSLKTIRKTIKEEIKKAPEKTKVFSTVYQKKLALALLQAQEVTQSDLKALAQSRAETIAAYLQVDQSIQKERIKLPPVEEKETDDEKWIRSSLALDVVQ